jgi:TRAP-type C4-dicarboxylate transport system substrate-binding protein
MEDDRMFMHSKLAKSLSLAALAIALGAAPSAQAASMWKGYSFISSTTHPDYKHLESLADEIEKIGQGDIRTKVNVGGSLPISGTSITQAVGDGVLTFAHDGYYTGNLPIGGISMLPMLIPDHDAFLRAKEKIEPVLASELAKKGVTLLATYNFPEQTIWGASEITSLNALKGSKMRVGNAPIAEFMLRNGATPITLATADVAPALERSVVDGVVTASAGGGRLWGDLLHSNYRLPLNYDLMLIIANKDAFDALSAEQHEKLRAAAKASADSLTAELADMENKVTQELQEKGLNVVQAEPQDITSARELMIEYWDTWAAGVSPQAKELLNQVKNAVGE